MATLSLRARAWDGASALGLGLRLALAYCLSAALLSGCATVALGLGGQVLMAATIDSVICGANDDGSGCNREWVGGAYAVQLEYPSAAVYRGFISVAEADGRKIVASDDATQSLHVSYPFSLLQNNWGGEITVNCLADGRQNTRVLFEHGNHDAASRVKKLESKLLEDVLDWLRQPAARAYLDALRDEAARQH